jgi:uncharacterized cupredoxin-like copper-binding protein
MSRHTGRVLPIALAVVVAGALAACGGGEGGGGEAGGGGGGGGGGGTVDVTLQEFSVIPAQASVASGEVTFNATNEGPDDPHELVVVKTDLDLASLPTKEDGSVDEEGSGVSVIGEIEEFDPGQSMSATFTLEPGKYVLLCNIVEEEDGQTIAHYRNGMRAAFEVTG